MITNLTVQRLNECTIRKVKIDQPSCRNQMYYLLINPSKKLFPRGLIGQC